MLREADFSPCRRWRFSLRRHWLTGDGKLTAIMLNPSKADERRDDPTTTFMIHIAQRLGMDRYEAANLFAFVDTDPRGLFRVNDPIGARNDAAIELAIVGANKIIIAWGDGGRLVDRDQTVLRLLDGWPLFCFGKTKSGAPRFPRAIRHDIELQRWVV